MTSQTVQLDEPRYVRPSAAEHNKKRIFIWRSGTRPEHDSAVDRRRSVARVLPAFTHVRFASRANTRTIQLSLPVRSAFGLVTDRTAAHAMNANIRGISDSESAGFRPVYPWPQPEPVKHADNRNSRNARCFSSSTGISRFRVSCDDSPLSERECAEEQGDSGRATERSALSEAVKILPSPISSRGPADATSADLCTAPSRRFPTSEGSTECCMTKFDV
jgi:hypothetical protein